MAVANRRWDRVPLWLIALQGDDVTPVTGKVRASLTGRVTRVDGRVLYPAGAVVEATLGDQSTEPAVRDLVRSAWRADDLAAARAADPGLDESAWADEWSARWDTLMKAAVFFGFPAVDDPDIVQNGWQVKIEERFEGGRTYFVEPRLADLNNVPPGVNLAAFEVPPGSPLTPAPVYAKGLPGGVASLDGNGVVPLSQLPASVGGAGGGDGESLATTVDLQTAIDGLATVARTGKYGDLVDEPDPAAGGGGATPGGVTQADLDDALDRLTAADVGAQPEGDYASPADITSAVRGLVRDDDARLTDARTPTAHTHPAAQVTGLAAVAITGSYNDLTDKPSLNSAGAQVEDATATTKGVLRLTGDLGGTADAPTVPGLADKVDGDDTRLSDDRFPTPHEHDQGNVRGLVAALDQLRARLDALEAGTPPPPEPDPTAADGSYPGAYPATY